MRRKLTEIVSKPARGKRRPYWELLRDPRWQKVRLHVMEREAFACQYCGDTSTTLNVHHTFYRTGADPWDYPMDSLECLCEPCHERAEEDRLKFLILLSRLSQQQRHKAFVELQRIASKWSIDTNIVAGGDFRAVITGSGVVSERDGKPTIFFEYALSDQPGHVVREEMDLANERERRRLGELCRVCGKLNPSDSSELHGIPMTIRLTRHGRIAERFAIHT